MNLVLEKFPLLCAAARNPSRFEVAVEQVLAGVDSGSIRNVVLQDVKFALSRIVDEAWNKHVSEPYFYAGKWQEQPEDVQALYDSISIMGLHDVIAASKKVAKSAATGPAVDAMRAYCAEVLPLSQAVASLKDKVVKGRAPSTGPAKPENPNKVVKTCPVCFRPIAVLRGTMAHHGYQRPGQGWQTASCPGIHFKPLEVSSEGLEWLIATLRERLAGLKYAHANQATHPEYLMAKRTHSGKAEKITRDDPLWSRVFARHIAEIESEMGSLERELPMLDKKLTDWKPEVQAS